MTLPLYPCSILHWMGDGPKSMDTSGQSPSCVQLSPQQLPLDGLPPGQPGSWEAACADPRCCCGLFGWGILECWARGTWSRRREGHRLPGHIPLGSAEPFPSGKPMTGGGSEGSSKQRSWLPGSKGGSDNWCSCSDPLSPSSLYFQALNM